MSSRDVEKSWKSLKNLRTAILLLVLGAAFIVFTVYPSSSPEPVRISRSDFKSIPLEDLDGKEVYLSDFEGKVVVLEFMATWCLTCAQQVPILKDFVSKYQSDDLVLVSVTIDPSFDTPDVLRSYVVKKELPWIHTRDTTMMLTEFFQVMELPTILIITPDGEVVKEFNGLTDLDTLSRAVDAVL